MTSVGTSLDITRSLPVRQRRVARGLRLSLGYRDHHENQAANAAASDSGRSSSGAAGSACASTRATRSAVTRRWGGARRAENEAVSLTLRTSATVKGADGLTLPGGDPRLGRQVAAGHAARAREDASMTLTFRKLHPLFVGEVSPLDLRRMHDEETLARIRAGMDEFAVLVFRNQPFADNEHLEFAQRLDGVLHTKLGISALQKNRLGNEALGDISNLDESGDIMKSDNRRRMYSLGNRLWHTDASFQDPPGRYSMLSAKVVPPGARGHRVRRHAGGVRRPIRRDEGTLRGAAG